MRPWPAAAYRLAQIDRLALFQALKALFAAAGPANTTQPFMAQRQAESGRYEPGRDLPLASAQLRYNLDRLHQRLGPVPLGYTVLPVLANAADQPPIGGGEAATQAYELGRLQLAQGQSPLAREAYQQAIALDPAPFRAPKPINQSLRDWATDHQAQWIDLSSLRQSSVFGALPDSLFFADHVHLNAQAQLWL
ncbi:hypothetical protein RZS08_14285, partial [Arthrospira platensis SPKY1]|nr:hypothetical protein [Arthrospira platensis SPKY1]